MRCFIGAQSSERYPQRGEAGKSDVGSQNSFNSDIKSREKSVRSSGSCFRSQRLRSCTHQPPRVSLSANNLFTYPGIPSVLTLHPPNKHAAIPPGRVYLTNKIISIPNYSGNVRGFHPPARRAGRSFSYPKPGKEIPVRQRAVSSSVLRDQQ